MGDIWVIYVIGAVFSLCLHIFNLSFFWALAWLTNEIILWHNLKKLEAQDDRSCFNKVTENTWPVLIDTLASWLTVPILAWRIGVRLLTVLNMRFAVVPEEIKRLRFPLWNNPDLSPEAVWAYTNALSVLNGDAVDWGELVRRLELLKRAVPNLDQQKAIELFEDLKVILLFL